ncbi:DeoR family transcriptional regulator [Streptomyces sp. P9(2023)]|uniref:DeoR family transcriptional regulator n=1 Tax=Streptomyces sp. P9(2023) TaxID=3064394 RepID=UPI0028F4455B|nr:DeoR family transcriptional regulator [Streptomyces sp. P9(2023)]MDT9689408.1 DeoR family transcriptional regulator [Streptomyces sp. P9(2023)]
MTGADPVAQRRGKVRRLAQGGASNRAIAAQLDISKDTVRRDLEWFEVPLAERMAQRAAQAETALSQVCAAAQAAADTRPAYVWTDPETARRWHDELRATAAQLTALADQFADYYPFAQSATGADPC